LSTTLSVDRVVTTRLRHHVALSLAIQIGTLRDRKGAKAPRGEDKMKTNSKVSKRAAMALLAVSATFSFIVTAEGSARSLTYVRRTVAAAACIPRTSNTSFYTVPGWDCGLPGGGDPNGVAVAAQLNTVYFDYTIYAASANPQLCIGKNSSSGSNYGDCKTATAPSSYPATREEFISAANVKQNANVWDYLYVDWGVPSGRVYSNYTPVDITLLGVGTSSTY